MFQICVIKENASNYFEKSLKESEEINKALTLLTFKQIDDLNAGLGDIFNPDFKLDKLNSSNATARNIARSQHNNMHY
jgi:hypothetical protein